MSDWRFTFIRLSPKLIKRYGFAAKQDSGLHAHWCPACEHLHDFAVDQPFSNGARWTFDGNNQAPTFGPSMNIAIGPDSQKFTTPFGDVDILVCHYFLHAGQIKFLNDCTHHLRGQTVDLPEIPRVAIANLEELH